jgi:integrase/recombinase XerD
MNTTSILSVHFFIKKYKAKQGHAPVYVRITLEGKSVDVSLKRNVNINDWDSKKEQVKGNRSEARSFNIFLEQSRIEILTCHSELKRYKKDITADEIKNSYCGITPKEHTLVDLMKYHNIHLKDMLEWGTMKNYMTTQRYIEMFINKIKKVKDISLTQLSYSFLVDFEIFLKSYKPEDHHKPCGHNTVLKHIGRLRKMVNLAIKNEWLEKDPFFKFKARFNRNDREFLSEEELDNIEHKNFDTERLIWVRDLFVFSCYTGLAYCDVMNLTNSNISKGIDGELWIMTERKKTKQSVRVPLLPQASEIIGKYRGHIRAMKTGTVFPTLSNQKLNAYLKEIADCCGIKKNLTFHLARHTFATTVTLINGVPIETVSKMLGHTSIRTTQIYAKVIEKKVSQDMSALKMKLEKRNSRYQHPTTQQA